LQKLMDADHIPAKQDMGEEMKKKKKKKAN
jgi:hypothetical protein